MDAAARRVLPGHLLRRCRVLSSIQLAGRCQQRVMLTACTGEELTTAWTLQRDESNTEWRLESIVRDTFGDSELPARPHPRTPPELVVLAQLEALRGGDVRGAAAFMLDAADSGVEAAAGSLREKLRSSEGFHVLLTQGSQPVLSSAAVPSDRVFLQEVIVEGAPGAMDGADASVHFLWTLHLGSDMCWATTCIELV